MVPSWGNDLRAGPFREIHVTIHLPARAIIQGFFIRHLLPFYIISPLDLSDFNLWRISWKFGISLADSGKGTMTPSHLCLPGPLAKDEMPLSLCDVLYLRREDLPHPSIHSD